MDEARRLSVRSPYGVVRASVQSAGRGRLPGRAWLASPGDSLLATFWFPAGDFGTAPLPLVAGLALVRALTAWAGAENRAFRNPLRLKWPNDALCGNRKLAGILCEARGETMYAGIGVNIRQTAFQTGFRTEPTSILLETGNAPKPDELLARLATALHSLQGGQTGWKDEYEAVLAWRGQRVSFSPVIDRDPFEAVLSGIDTTGAVILDRLDGTGPTGWASGELSARY